MLECVQHMELVVADRSALIRPTEASTQEARDAFLRKARARFRQVSDAESMMRAAMLDDLKFRASEQWPADIQRQRQVDGRPCLTINRLPQFIHQITNQQRQNKPAAVVSPVDSAADPKTAEVFQGMIRHIERQSQAQVAYNTACDAQATIGRGYLRILTQYESETDFNQSLIIKRVRNPFSIYMDPACQELDYSDAMYAFVVSDLTEDAYRDRFGEIAPVSLHDFASIGDEKAYWLDGKAIRIAEYWYVDAVADRLLELESGDTILQSSVPVEAIIPGPEGAAPSALVVGGMSVRVRRSRITQKRVVKWATISGLDVLEGNEARTEGREWPGKNIPIIPVIGDEIDLNGNVDLRGIVRDAKDPQRRYNYQVSAETETLALMPKSPFVVADGQLEGYEDLWRQANVKNYSFLPYKAQSLDGHLLGAPQRVSSGADISSVVQSIAQADNDLKAVTGFYEASLGQTGPEQSGKAILARQRQGDIGSFNYQDNLALAVATVGRYLVDLIPKVYDIPRIIRILGPDDRPKTVMVHAGQPPQPDVPMEGLDGVYDVNAGVYDVTTHSGPSYESRRQEAVATMTQFVQAFPPTFPMIGDLLAQHMDWPGAAQIADRFRKMLPPPLQETGPDGKPKAQEPPPEMVEQMKQMNDVIEKMSAELQQKDQLLQAKQLELQTQERIAQIDAQSRERIATIQSQSALAKVQSTMAQKEMDLQSATEVKVTAMETDSREKVAQLQSATQLAVAEQKIDGAIDLAAIKAQLAELSARLGLASGASNPSDRAGL